MPVTVIAVILIISIPAAIWLVNALEDANEGYWESMRRSVAMDRRIMRERAIYNALATNRYYPVRSSNQSDDDNPLTADHERFVQEQARLASTGFEFGGFDTSLPDNPAQFVDEMNSFNSTNDSGFGF